ncbi:MAG TPA: S1-like domain-containing RNA-binding protein [Verrucomicrobiae bacterium]|nr:S1-like domain-containing RNA-binding protein [Verrucomicrobiae bacterium]
MIQVGKFYQLKIANFASFGAYLDAETGNRQDNILLPGKQVPPGSKVGDSLEVYIYHDSENRKIATTRKPLAQTGDLAYLKVTAKTQLGAFLDIGLERDLFLPFREQKFPVAVGKSYLVAVYTDKSGRLTCTLDVYDKLTTDSQYQKNDKVTGTVYLIVQDIGAFVAVDNKYKGLIPVSELYQHLSPGDQVQVRVIRRREDGKLDLSTRELTHNQMEIDGEVLLTAMRNNNGYLPLDEKAPPHEIEKRYHMSKAAFKRAIGGLLKSNAIVKSTDGIKLR